MMNTNPRGDGHGTGTYLRRRDYTLTFPPERTALLVTDPVNDVLSEGGAAWELTRSTVTQHDVIGHLKRAIEGARQRGIPVLFGPMAYTEEDYQDEELQRRSPINRVMFEKKMFLAGSWGADFHPELRPRSGDIVLLPHKGMDVFETDLPEHLSRLGTTHLVIAGMAANLCCESTGRHALERGYDVTYLADAIGAENQRAYEAAVLVNYPLIANAVLQTDEFLRAIGASGPPLVAVGDSVRSSDHVAIGEVAQVVEKTVDVEAHLVVPRGLIFRKDTYIPFDAVVRRSGREVFINVPQIVIGRMPWSEPPGPDERRAKEGPAVAEVLNLYGSRSPSLHEGGGTLPMA
jgi:nicotinamidase-related amidase